MPPKKRVKKCNQNDVKEETVIKISKVSKISKTKPTNNGLKRSVGRPKKSLPLDSSNNSSNGSNPKRKRPSDTNQSQIVFTFKEKKAFYECLVENGFSAIHNENILLKTLPNRSLNEIKSMIESYSRRGQELGKRSEESVDSETNSDKQPIEKWYDLIHQTIPNTSKKDDISAIFAEIFDELAKDCEQKLSSKPSSSSAMTSNYSAVYHYISETLRGKFPPELEPIDAFVILKLIEELKELFKSDDYETEREFLASGKWLQRNGVKSNQDYYSAIHLQRQQENRDSVNSSVNKKEIMSNNENNTQINELTDSDLTKSRNSRNRFKVTKVKDTGDQNQENGETSLSQMVESQRQSIDYLLNFPKLRKIVDCLNPIQVTVDLSKEEFSRWQK